MNKLTLILALLIPASGMAQTYSINWYKVAAGGGTSTNGQYSLSGTIGQQDAVGTLTGGTYSLTGGYWSIIAVASAPGVPNLTIQPVGANSVVVSWPATGSYTLQQNSNLSCSNCRTANTNGITSANGTNRITISPPVGSMFFRLKR